MKVTSPKLDYSASIVTSRVLYKNMLKPILFQFDPEFVHDRTTILGEWLGSNKICKKGLEKLFCKNYSQLTQQIAGISFSKPAGLAAGFDYDAKLMQVLPSLGFGFETIGTITFKKYRGNPGPMLGRLPKSRSLMVNKGFKNKGAKAVANKLDRLNFNFPFGISIGRTNDANLTQQESVQDIIDSLLVFQKSKVSNSYFEINISCPNLYGNITFYTVKNLNALLREIEKLNIDTPFFIKMPIELNNKRILSLLAEISKYPYIKGVIFGNLQKNRQDVSLIQKEVSQWKMGNFSGKPTWQRSNELISLCYKNYSNRFIIIGCGGVFSAKDAYTKIKLGASLIQLITGMVYEGPQLISEINAGLAFYLERDGYAHISEAIGKGNFDH